MRWVLDPDPDHVLDVAENIRSADELEVHLSHQMSGREATIESWAYSDIVRGMVTDDGVACGLCGVVGQRIWMLGTDRLTESRRHRWQLCVQGRQWVDETIKELNAPLFNQVYSKNHESIRWLKYLGFTVERPRPIGLSGALFCDFWRNS